jgi:hypothetical protein
MPRAALTGIFAIALTLAAAAVPGPAQDLGQYPDNSLENRYRGMVAANVDSSNGRDELIVDFGAVGVWVRTGVINNSGEWHQISGVNPDWIISASWVDPGDDEIVGDFGALGLWTWDFSGYPGVWTQISGVNAEQAFALDDDGDAHDELEVDFGNLGLWRYDANTGLWMQLSALNPQPGGIRALMWTGAVEQGVWSFPGYGVWNVHTDTAGSGPYIWQISVTDPGVPNIPADFGVGDAYDELIMAQPPHGTWLCQGTTYPSVSWHQISPNYLEGAAKVRFDGDTGCELLADFSGTAAVGFWMWDYGGFPGTWELLNATDPGAGLFEPFDPNGYVPGTPEDEEVAVDFDSQGLWLYDRTTGAFSQLSGIDPAYMVRADFWDDGTIDECLAVDFGAAGLWAYDGYENTWYQLSGLSPD